MDLHHLFTVKLTDSIPQLFKDSIKCYTELYRLVPGSKSDGGGLLVHMEKKQQGDKEIAIVCLLLQLLQNSNLVPASPTLLDGKAFLKLLLQERVLPTTKSEPISNAVVIAFYNWLHQAVLENPEREFEINGAAHKPQMLLRKEDLVTSLAFKDAWNEKLYYIESHNSWWLLSWIMDE
jgi:hypothetical protein